MKENVLNWTTILMVAIVCIVIVSCGDDDDAYDNKQGQDEMKVSIIGSWRYSWGDGPRGYTAYSFFDDGTGLVFDKGNGAERFTYTFDAPTGIVSIEYDEYYKDQMTISQITSESLVIDGDEYKKVELTYDMLILGEWFLHVDPRSSFGKGTRVNFQADSYVQGKGTYEAKDYYNDDATNEWDSSFYVLKGKVSGTWSITGKRLSIKGSSQIVGEYIIEGLVVDGCRLVKASSPNEYPYLLGGWHQR